MRKMIIVGLLSLFSLSACSEETLTVTGSIEDEINGEYVLYVGEDDGVIEQSVQIDGSIPNAKTLEVEFDNACAPVNVKAGMTLDDAQESEPISQTNADASCENSQSKSSLQFDVGDNQYFIFQSDDIVNFSVSGTHTKDTLEQ